MSGWMDATINFSPESSESPESPESCPISQHWPTKPNGRTPVLYQTKVSIHSLNPTVHVDFDLVAVNYPLQRRAWLILGHGVGQLGGAFDPYDFSDFTSLVGLT